MIVHTRELAPETESCSRFAPGACSIISNQFDSDEGAKFGSKSFVAQHIFSLEIVGADEGALLRERVAGALWEQAPSCVLAYNVQWLELVYEMATFYRFAKVLEEDFDEKR